MRFLIQEVSEARVEVAGQTVGEIGRGFLVFVGISNSDTEEYAKEHNYHSENKSSERKKAFLNMVDRMVEKLVGLRIFRDENGRTNLDMKTVGGQMLIVSQFTLYADCRKGKRPSFGKAGDPQMANEIYRYVIEKCREEIGTVEEGSFGAEMRVSLVNEGPFTVLLDSDELYT